MFRVFSIIALAATALTFSQSALPRQIANTTDGQAGPGQSDPRVRITSPISGTVFAPGDQFMINVSIDASIQPSRVVVGMHPGIFGHTDTPPYRIPIVIPPNFAGWTEISPLILIGDNDEILGESISVLVRPAVPPIRLHVDNFVLLHEPPASHVHGRIVVQGDYADEVWIDLSSGATGTTYLSADPGIADVDADGNVSAISAGATYVTSENRGVFKFTTVRVQGAVPPPPVDVTSQLRIEQTALHFDAPLDRFVQTVTFTNDGPIPIPGLLALTLDALPKEVNWTNHDGVTIHVPPVGADYSMLDVANGVSLMPGEATSIVLQFQDPGPTPITYSPRISQIETP